MLDPSITLFGKRIQVNGEGGSECEVEVEVEDEDSPRSNYESSVEKFDSEEQLDDEVTEEVAEEESTENDQPEDPSEEAMDESTNAPEVSETINQTEKATDSESQQVEKESNDTKKQLKKPDKILPCPRCKSMDTKFCYYNNYNVNQPRHYCKNCQRYWTAGGTMRNVPVGAGRRKNKNSASRFCHSTVSEALDVSDGVHHPGLKPINGTVLTFGLDYPQSDPKALNGTSRHVVHDIERQGAENADDHSSGSTVTTGSMEDRSKKGRQEPNQHFNGFNNQMQCFQWPYMWHPSVPFCPAVFPMPIYPNPYWNGAPVAWNYPWVTSQNSPVSNPNSPLGKHTRDSEIRTPSDNGSTTVLIPKTLRIDDPNEAARSSIWTTLGIRKDKGDSISKGFFNSFQSEEAEKKNCEVEADPVFKANPVALCRSSSFQERV